MPSSLRASTYFFEPHFAEVDSKERLIDEVARANLYIAQKQRQAVADVEGEISQISRQLAAVLRREFGISAEGEPCRPSSPLVALLLHLEQGALSSEELVEEWRALPEGVRRSLSGAASQARGISEGEALKQLSENPSLLLSIHNENGENPLEVLIEQNDSVNMYEYGPWSESAHPQTITPHYVDVLAEVFSAVNQNADVVFRNIRALAIAEGKTPYQLVRSCVDHSPEASKRIAKNIAHLDIDNELERMSLALKCAESTLGAEQVAANIVSYGLREERRYRALLLCAAHNRAACVVAKNIASYALREEQRYALALKCVEGNWGALQVGRNIALFGLSEERRYALALKCVENDWGAEQVAENIASFELEDENQRYRVLVKCVASDWGAEQVAENIASYGLNEDRRYALALKCVETYSGAAAVLCGIRSFGLKEEQRYALALQCAARSNVASMAAERIASFKLKGVLSLNCLTRCIASDGETSSGATKTVIERINKKQGDRAKKLCVLLVFYGCGALTRGEALDDRTKTLVIRALRLPSQRVVAHAASMIPRLGSDAGCTASYHALQATGHKQGCVHSMLLSLMLAELAQRAEGADCDEGSRWMRAAFLLFREELRDSATRLELEFAQTIVDLFDVPHVAWNAIARICSLATNERDENTLKQYSRKERKALAKNNLKALQSSLGGLRLLKAAGFFSNERGQTFLSSAFTQQELTDEVTDQCTKQLFENRALAERERALIAFGVGYLANEQRVPFALERYAKTLRDFSEQDEASLQDAMETFVLSVLGEIGCSDGRSTYRAMRYDPSQSEHLRRLSEHSELFERWQSTECTLAGSAAEVGAGAEEPLHERSRHWLRQKLLDDRHLDVREYPALRAVAEGGEIPPESEAIDLQMAELCQALLQEVTPEETEAHLQALKRVIDRSALLRESQWARDVADRIQEFALSNNGATRAMITDDWQDMLLSGTEVLGSCQSIYGTPSLNKCLLSYCTDGKIQMAAIKDAKTGALRARALLKLLITEDGSPALFFERVYPTGAAPGHAEKLLALAKQRARELGASLYTSGELPGEVARLHSLGTSAPYEYADAAQGMNSGAYTIHGIRVPL